ncbi:MAG: leukotoxin LktA family filamentous adhesin, partial [Rhodobacterales bacterium]
MIVTGSTTKITTGTVSQGVGYNSFLDFQEAAGQRVDLYVPDRAGSLVNIVKNGSVVINGTLNSYKDGKIGGNIFFSSPDGFVVGKSGSINVGSLTVNTPTRNFLDKVVRADGTVDNAVAQQLMRGEIPMSSNGVIVIAGEVNASGTITLQGHTVRINGKTGPLTGKDIGQRTKFNATVNASGMIEGAKLVSRGGKVSIVSTGNTSISGSIQSDATANASGKGGDISVQAAGDILIESAAAFLANGLGAQGDGGSIIVKADNTLNVADHALFSAVGTGNGDGGFVELSGKRAAIGAVITRLGAENGVMGTLYIDPLDLLIGSTTANINSNGANVALQADNSITVINGGIIDTRMMTAGVTSGASGSITLVAPKILLQDGSAVLAGVTAGSAFAAGDVTFTASRTTSGVSEITIGDGLGGTANITGKNIAFNATATLGSAGFLLALPKAQSRISVLSGAINATGAFSATATATADAGLGSVPLGVVVANVDASVQVLGASVISAQTANLISIASAKASILTKSLTPASSSADGAVAINTVTSNSTSRVGGTAKITAATVNLDATNTVISKADATPAAAAFGASVGVSVVNATTLAEITGSGYIVADDLSVSAATVTSVDVKTGASAGGASAPESGSKAKTYLDDPKYGGAASTSGGKVSIAAALSISDLNSTTSATVDTVVATIVTNNLTVKTSSENSASVVADGTAAKSATGVGAAVGINIAKVKNDATIASNISANSADISALMTGAGNVFTTTTTSGAGASNVGIAGSFGLNLIDTQSSAVISPAAAVTLTGAGGRSV